MDDRLEDLFDAASLLRAREHRAARVQADDVLDLTSRLLGLRARQLEESIGERRFPVIDVRDDREVADEALVQPALPLLDRNECLWIWRADVVGSRADQPVVLVLLEHVRGPAGNAADREDRR